MALTSTRLSFENTLSGVYTISCSESPKIYIGSTECFKKRFNNHVKELRNNTHGNKKLQNSWNLHGEKSFSFEEAEECSFSIETTKKDKRDILFSMEQYYLDLILKANHNDKYFVEFAYNVNRKAEGGGTVERAVSVFDLDMNFIEEFVSPIAASKKYGRHAGIVGCCNGKLGRVVDKIFRYSDNINIDFKYKERKTGYTRKDAIPIFQYSLSGDFIQEWRCAQEVYNKLDINWANISKVLKGEYQMCGGFMWKYEKFDKIESYKSKIISYDLYDLADNFIKNFTSCKEIADSLGVEKYIIHSGVNKNRVIKKDFKVKGLYA